MTTAAPFLIVLLLTACGGTDSEFDRLESPNGDYVLVVTVTVPNLPHARHLVKVSIVDLANDMPTELVETKLANDGVPFTEHNIGMRWTSATTALVCLRPTDREDRGIRINLKPSPKAEIRSGC